MVLGKVAIVIGSGTRSRPHLPQIQPAGDSAAADPRPPSPTPLWRLPLRPHLPQIQPADDSAAADPRPPSPTPLRRTHAPQKSAKHGAGQVCQICGDGVGTAADGELFTTCDVCGFPVCRPCYEYERKDGTRACPQCKTKYKCHKVNCTRAAVLSRVALSPTMAKQSEFLDFDQWLNRLKCVMCWSLLVRSEESDVDADDASDYNYPASGNQDQKQKLAERMLPGA